MDLNSARIEVLLEEITHKIKMFHDNFSQDIDNIDLSCNTSHMDREALFSLLNEAVLMSSKSTVELVLNQIELSTEEDRKPIYHAQLKGSQDNLEKALTLPIRVKRVRHNQTEES
jgi:hypothetical protein